MPARQRKPDAQAQAHGFHTIEPSEPAEGPGTVEPVRARAVTGRGEPVQPPQASPPAHPRRPAHEARVFQPSTFATRYAERAARGETGQQPQRLASLGVVSTWLDGFGSRRKGQMANIEYLYDVDHPANRYRRIVPNGTLEPLTTAADDPPPEPLGILAPHGIASGYWPTPTTPDTRTPVA